jgi:hypothetical protein
MNDIYNFKINVDYLTTDMSYINDDDRQLLYKNQLDGVLMINKYEHDDYILETMDKIDGIYRYLKTHHDDFLKYILYKIVTIGDNHIKLSNNLYFYLCMRGFTQTLSIDVNKNFNIMDHYKNSNVELFMLSFLFGFECFENLHFVLKKYFEGNNFNLNAPELFNNDDCLTSLSYNFTQTFCSRL